MKQVDTYFVKLEEKLKTDFKLSGEVHLKQYIQDELLRQITSIKTNISEL